MENKDLMKAKDVVMRTTKSKEGLKKLIKYLSTNLGKLSEYKRMLEIGSFKGDSTVIFAKHFAEVYAVDPYLNYIGDITDKVDMKSVRRYFKKNIKDHENIHHIEMMSVDAAALFENESLDFVYIDGLHTYEAEKEDIQYWLPKVKSGGFIGGHDYHSRFKGVIRAVHEELGKPDITFNDMSWLKKVK